MVRASARAHTHTRMHTTTHHCARDIVRVSSRALGGAHVGCMRGAACVHRGHAPRAVHVRARELQARDLLRLARPLCVCVLIHYAACNYIDSRYALRGTFPVELANHIMRMMLLRSHACRGRGAWPTRDSAVVVLASPAAAAPLGADAACAGFARSSKCQAGNCGRGTCGATADAPLAATPGLISCDAMAENRLPPVCGAHSHAMCGPARPQPLQ